MTNFLIITSDEHRADAMGCAGHNHVRTPHLDRLAASGTRFSNAYTASPMCVPARAALATGQFVHQTRHWDSASPYSGNPQSWMHKVRGAGHKCVSIGKLHFRSTEDDNGFSEEILPMHVAGGIGWTIGLLRKELPDYEGAADLSADVGEGASSYTDYDRAITQAAINWIEEAGEKQTSGAQDKGWSAFISLVSPHYPLTCPPEFNKLYQPQDMALPIGYGKGAPTHPELARTAAFFDYDRHFDAQTMRAAKCAYFGLTSFMDDCVGKILDALERSGQTEDTVICYISDHGELLGDHGLWTKQVMYEGSVAVPMILSGPGIPAGHICHTPVMLTDIAPTVLDVMNIQALEIPRSTSLVQIANQPDQMERIAFSEYHDGGSTMASFMVRWQHWKYIHYVGAPPQLFDLHADPDEQVDLYSCQPHTQTIKDALAKGEASLRNICDPEAVNANAFADQAEKIAALGGEEACLTRYAFNHTPVPV